MADIQILDTEVLSDNRYPLRLIRYRQETAGGKTIEQQREIYDHGNAVTVLLYNRKQRTLVLTRQFRLPTYLTGNASGMLLESCAGLVEEGEDPADTMKREIEEETGFAVDRVEKIYEAYTSPGFSTEKVFFYIAEYDPAKRAGKGGGLEEEGEDIGVVELPVEEAIQQLQSGKIQDVKAIVLLQYLQLRSLL
jgi:nudix-type nucleoside diphosphatase (YffH/AdpP family)